MNATEHARTIALTDEVQRLAAQLKQESGEVRSRTEVARSLRLAVVRYWIDTVGSDALGLEATDAV